MEWRITDKTPGPIDVFLKVEAFVDQENRLNGTPVLTAKSRGKKVVIGWLGAAEFDESDISSLISSNSRQIAIDELARVLGVPPSGRGRAGRGKARTSGGWSQAHDEGWASLAQHHDGWCGLGDEPRKLSHGKDGWL